MSLDTIDKIITADSPVNNSTLQAVAMIPTQHLTALVDKHFIAKLADKDFMRIAVLLAKKVMTKVAVPLAGLLLIMKPV